MFRSKITPTRLCHFVYPWYPVISKLFIPAARHGSAMLVGLGGTCIDNFIHSPCFYLPSFYFYTDQVQGSSFTEAKEHLKAEWWEVRFEAIFCRFFSACFGSSRVAFRFGLIFG